MGVTIYSIVASVIFFNIALVTAFIMRRSSTFVARRTVSYLLLMVLLGIIRLLTPIDFDKAFVVRSYQVLPMIEDFLNRPIVGSYTFGSLLLLVWLAGTVTFIVRDMIIQIRFIHASRNYPPSDRRDLLDLAGEYGDNFGLLVSSSISRPYTAGLFRPVIYLPDIELPEEQWRTILRHEVQHIRSHDEVKKLFFLAIQALFWWNPLAHISRKEIDTILELQCDAKVTAGMSNEEVDAYLDLLWTLKERKAEQRIPVGASTMVWDQKQLEARFEALQNDGISRKRPLRAAMYCFLMALFMLSYFVIIQPARFPNEPGYWDESNYSDEIYIFPFSLEESHEYIVYKNNEYHLFVDGNYICRVEEEALSERPFKRNAYNGGKQMKRVLSMLLALIVTLSVAIPAFADTFEAPDGSDVEIIAIKPGESTRAEETTWYFRVYHGMVQMRKWSITYGRWLTDWIDVGPYEGG